ncbi:MAG: response regulator [Candidatus Omnitrophica bacterium]|nr:response regulator [Candidatus Omnitrophota bacterium]
MARILIIDDEKGVCEEFSEVLREEKHEVDCAFNATEGIQKIQSQSFDLIFLDVLMPKMEGREALQKIKEITQTPVVIMSGYLPSHKEKSIVDSGALACLKKPLELNQVFGLIEKALESKNKKN